MKASTDTVSHIKITAASLIALATTVVGAVCATVPSISPDKQVIIGALTAVITASFLVANAVHALATSHTSVKLVEQDVEAQVKAELQRILSAGIATPAAPSA